MGPDPGEGEDGGGGGAEAGGHLGVTRGQGHQGTCRRLETRWAASLLVPGSRASNSPVRVRSGALGQGSGVRDRIRDPGELTTWVNILH